MTLYRRTMDAVGKPFPAERPMQREVFVAKTREDAIRLCAPHLGTKCAASHAWRQGMPQDDKGLRPGVFVSPIGDHVPIG